MEFLLFPLSGLIMAIATFVASDSASRRFVFYIFWLAGAICFVLSGLLFLSISAAERYGQIITPHTIFAVLGFFGIVAASLSSQSIGKAALFDKLMEERQYRAASEITQLAASNSSLMELLNYSLEKLIAMLGLAGGVIHVFHRAKENLVLGSYMGLSPRLARRLETIEMGDTAIGRTARNRRLLIIRNLRLSQDYEFLGGKQEGFTYMALIPIVSEGENWGVISLFGKGTYQPGSLQVDLLEQFGEQLGAALVLGRQVRNTQSSRDNFSALFKAVGEELLTASASGSSAVRGLSWMVTRFFGGDRYDICSRSKLGWNVVLSSDTSSRLRHLTAEAELMNSTSTSGVTNWDQPPPFQELTQGKAYAFTALNSGRDCFIIRLEGRRRAAVDLEMLTDAFRVIMGLQSQLAVTAKRKVAELPVSGHDSTAARKLDRVSGELGRLVAAYSGSGGSPELKELFAWLEAIRRSAEEQRPESPPPGKHDNLGPELPEVESIIRNAIDTVAGRGDSAPDVVYDRETELPVPSLPAEHLSQSIMEFMTAAISGVDSGARLHLASRGDERSIVLELRGENLSEIPRADEKPSWLRNIGGRLESHRIVDDEGRSLDAWRLLIPVDGIAFDERPESLPRVLAVDNQEVIRELLDGMLTSLGYDTTVVSSSEEAVERFTEARENGRPYKIVVADSTLERSSGMDLATNLKSLDHDIFFVLLSGWGMAPDEKEAHAMGIDAMLKKPFRIEQLSETLGAALHEEA